jgi:hypothetical protein
VSRRLLYTLVCVAALWGCNDTTPSSPSIQSQPSVSGRWTGNLAVQGVTGRMTWTLTQSGSSVSGPALIGLPSGTVLLNGTLTGTLTGTSLAYAIAVGPSGVPTQPTCTGQLGGTMNAKAQRSLAGGSGELRQPGELLKNAA